MNVVNFIQLLSKNASDSGEDILGIFDTLVCERGKNSFTVNVCFSQIAETAEVFEKYYYRVVLRCLGKNRSESKNYRVDSGILFDEIKDKDESIACDRFILHQTTHPGCSGRLSITFGFDIEQQGNYEVDLYVKRMDDDDTFETCEEQSVKKLDLVSIAPFQIIFQNAQ